MPFGVFFCGTMCLHCELEGKHSRFGQHDQVCIQLTQIESIAQGKIRGRTQMEFWRIAISLVFP